MWYLVLIFISFLIFAVIGGLMEIWTRDEYGEAAGKALFFGNLYGMITMTVIFFIMNSKLTKKEPEAIDVYRDKVELKIKHVIENGDTISSDTTVIWKEHGLL